MDQAFFHTQKDEHLHEIGIIWVEHIISRWSILVLTIHLKNQNVVLCESFSFDKFALPFGMENVIKLAQNDYISMFQ